MTWTKVASSTIAAIGWESGTLAVRYRNGDVYECQATASDHAYLMAAPSKGSHLAMHFRQRLKRSDNSAQKLTSGENLNAPVKISQALSELNTTEFDPCCSKLLGKELFSGRLDGKESWTCGKCGAEWKKRLIEGLNHWEPTAAFEIFQMPGR